MSYSPESGLREALGRRRVAILVGAGVSMGATAGTDGAKNASWSGLLRDGVRYVREGGIADDAWQTAVDAQLACGDLEMLLTSAELLTLKLGGVESGEFARWLEGSVGALKVADDTVLKALGSLNPLLLTTNYDELIETVTGLPAITWKDHAELLRALDGSSRAVVHLHGHWRRPDTVVFGTRSYERVLASDPVQGFLRALFSTYTVIFVGCGEGLNDPNFDALLKWSTVALGGSPLQHFRLCLNAERMTFSGTAVASRVIACPYGDNHAELPRFIAGLARPVIPAASAATRPSDIVELGVGRPLSRDVVRKILFDIYDPSVEPYYYKRAEDKSMSDAAKMGSVWVYGPSGVGKTSLIRRALSQAGASHRYVCLAHCAGAAVVSTLRAMLSEVREWVGVEDSDLSRSTVQTLIAEISTVLRQVPGESGAILYLDELPIGADEVSAQFVQAMVSLVNYHASVSAGHDMRIMLSSIPSPVGSVASYQRQVMERIHFMPLMTWTTGDLSGLADSLLPQLPLKLSFEERQRLVGEVSGSPRALKACLRLLSVHIDDSRWNFERALAAACAEAG